MPPFVRAGFRVTSALAPTLAARLALRLFFTPARARVRAEERAVLERGERFMVEVRGRRVAGRAWGKGPAVLAVHGWGGHSGQMAPLVAPLVEAGFRVVAIDLPAHGESEGRLSSIVHCADALERAAALFAPLHGVAAHSFGAAATAYALSRGMAVERAVFYAPPARFASFWARFRAGAGVSDTVWLRMVVQSEAWLDVAFDGIQPIHLAPRMTAPLLVLHDPEDREMAFAEGRDLARHWPGARLHPAPGCGHLRILRDEGCIGEAVRFISA